MIDNFFGNWILFAKHDFDASNNPWLEWCCLHSNVPFDNWFLSLFLNVLDSFMISCLYSYLPSIGLKQLVRWNGIGNICPNLTGDIHNFDPKVIETGPEC